MDLDLDSVGAAYSRVWHERLNRTFLPLLVGLLIRRERTRPKVEASARARCIYGIVIASAVQTQRAVCVTFSRQ
ncbi:hypothetical protein SPRG_16228 [Saprolegnia parasitica CBS 223.65]|uniref:Uncharacterized protein n=1 Tax=Saprolegnia parasitica (strain CBS 223.65) TaxID=695850 RepID=A0A067BVT8_SAPPC|nr:hypothetical protein SPRG_16228 [Saprolegnia parasitica CBS 223.65]KDO18416.1 hypothetical protein SPRG_16228 [Saprolegnia parasitica CBS 223.65]|eukprot:XP_012210881.1 hypothetical protein SPRG_16228 [Saprolegnia parasitica CBS 223.65]